MKNMTRQLAVVAIASTLLVSQAFAMTATKESVKQNLNASHLNTHSLNVSVHDGIVTLSGNVDDNLTRVQAQRIALNTDGVSGVVNLITGN